MDDGKYDIILATGCLRQLYRKGTVYSNEDN